MITVSRVLAAITTLSIVAWFPLNAQTSTPTPGNADIGICSDGQCDSQIRSLHALARYGSLEAMTVLSMVYATGDGREADPDRGLRFLQRAARHRHPMALFQLSEWYREGFVVEQDLVQAESLLTDAVNLGYPGAEYKRAMQLLHQTDATSQAEGMVLLQQASDKRLVDAMYILARLKQEGFYTEQDLEGAAKLYKSLVLSGHQQSRPFLRQTIDMLAAKADAVELVADLQQAYDIEVIQVIGRDFKVDTMLGHMVSQLQRSGLYSRGSIMRIRSNPCDGGRGCYSVIPERGDTDLNQTITGQP